MKLRFLIDQNISIKTAEFLKRLGLSTSHVKEIGLAGKPDDAIYNYAKANDLVIITFDHEFGYTFMNRKDLSGLIILRIHPQILDMINRTLTSFFGRIKETDIKGNIVVLEKQRFRIRKVR